MTAYRYSFDFSERFLTEIEVYVLLGTYVGRCDDATKKEITFVSSAQLAIAHYSTYYRRGGELPYLPN